MADNSQIHLGRAMAFEITAALASENVSLQSIVMKNLSCHRLESFNIISL